MARTLNPEAHALRRDEFVDVAQRLIATKGYEQLSVQDVLDELGASKGAFYHYFDSKAALLQGVVERIVDAATATLTPIACDPSLCAVAKIEGIFAALAQWKTERKELMLALIRVWFSDDNAMTRDKLRQAMASRLTPLLAVIMRQGTAEGAFTVRSPDQTAGVFVSLLQGANETASHLFLDRQAGTISFEEVEQTLAAYTEAYERILGLAAGTFRFMDRPTLRFWFG